MIKNISTLILITLIIYSVIILFQQNLLISGSFPILPMREVDDFAFQHTLNKLHTALYDFNFVQFFNCNDYGYGSIFWVLNSIVSYPGYLLQNDQLTIISPRMLSLLFGVLSLIYAYKISKKYTDNIAIQLSAPAILVLIPEFAFMCLRFHTHSQLLFFSLLCFYFATNYKNDIHVIKKILFVMAVAIGTKINALILVLAIAPILLIIHKDQNNNEISYKFIFLHVIFTTFFTLLFYNPLLIFFPLFLAESYNAIKVVLTHIYYSGINQGHASNEYIGNLLINGLSRHYASYLTIPLSITTLITGYMFYKDDKFSEKILAYILIFMSTGFLIAAIILLFRVKSGPWSYANYVIPLFFSIIFSAIIFDRFKSDLKYLLLSFFMISLFFLNQNNIEEFYYRYENQKNSLYNKTRMDTFKDLENIIQPSENRKVKVLIDHNILAPVSSLDKNFLRTDFYNSFASYNDNYDYILVTKNNVMLDKKENIIKKYKNSAPYLLGKEKFNKLNEKGLFNNSKYDIVFENKTILVFGIR